MHHTIKRMIGCMAAAMLISAGTAALAEGYPDRPIRMIVPQAAGGANDIIARIVAEDLSRRLGQSIVIDNRPGAGGNIGTAAAAKAAPDGYTLLMTVLSSQAINPFVYAEVPFDPVKDFAPVSYVASVPNVLIANQAFAARTFPEFLAQAKAHPGKYRYGTPGNGTLNHLLGEMLNQTAGISIEHVPYRGASAAINDVIGGQIELSMASLPSALPFIQGGKVIALGITAEGRSPLDMTIPAIAETLPGFVGAQWVGLFSVAGTPDDVLDTLSRAMQETLQEPGVKEKLLAQGADIKLGTRADFARLLAQDLTKWQKIVADTKATIN